MLNRNPTKRIVNSAQIFAALGDETRLQLVTKLSCGEPMSITELSHGHKLSRQGVTKHLKILEHVKLVRRQKLGRKSIYQIAPEPFNDVRNYLETISEQWDNAISRLKSQLDA